MYFSFLPRFFFILCFFILFSLSRECVAQERVQKPIFILSTPYDNSLPNNYRTENEFSLESSFLTISKNLPLICSQQFSQKQFLKIYKNHPNIQAVVDLCEEPHFFINGLGITYFAQNNWANKGLSISKIHQKEENILKYLRSQKQFTVFKIHTIHGKNVLEPVTLKIDAVETEYHFINRLGLHYLRLYVPDHMFPSPKNVDKFINLIFNVLPHTALIYLHDFKGKGRATTFAILYDMMKNAKTDSLETILNRQHDLKGKDLLQVNFDTPLKRFKKERLIFLKKFYWYARSNTDNFRTLWSSYDEEHLPVLKYN